MTDFLDLYGAVSPYTAFQNLAFDTNPAINAPNQGGWGSQMVLLWDRISMSWQFGGREC